MSGGRAGSQAPLQYAGGETATAVRGYTSTRYSDWHTAPRNAGPRLESRSPPVGVRAFLGPVCQSRYCVLVYEYLVLRPTFTSQRMRRAVGESVAASQRPCIPGGRMPVQVPGTGIPAYWSGCPRCGSFPSASLRTTNDLPRQGQRHQLPRLPRVLRQMRLNGIDDHGLVEPHRQQLLQRVLRLFPVETERRVRRIEEPRLRRAQTARLDPFVQGAQRPVRIERENHDLRLHEPRGPAEPQRDGCRRLGDRREPLAQLVDREVGRDGTDPRRSRQRDVRWAEARQPRIVRLLYLGDVSTHHARDRREDEDATLRPGRHRARDRSALPEQRAGEHRPTQPASP